VYPTTITTGSATELRILVINNQDEAISYQVKDAKIVNEEAYLYHEYWQVPPPEERLSNAIISGCKVEFDGSSKVIAKKSSDELTFIVTCPMGTNPAKEYLLCDNYERNENCRKEIADTTYPNNICNGPAKAGQNCSNGNIEITNYVLLWGNIEFEDELGNKHMLSDKGVLKQMLEIN
jgi:hypothetical protein